MSKCKICSALVGTRFDVCFDCADFESLITDGTDMYDKPIEVEIEGSPALNLLYHIIRHYTNVVGGRR